MTKKFRIKYSISSVYYSQSNGLVEQFNRILCEGIAKVVNTVLDWNILIQLVLFVYHTKKLCITNATPYELIYEKKVTIPIDNQEDIMYVKRMIDIMERVSQLRTNAKQAIKKIQHNIEKTF